MYLPHSNLIQTMEFSSDDDEENDDGSRKDS